MKNILSRLENLSPERRELLIRALKQQAKQSKTFPVSFAQQRMWLLDQLSPGVAIYTISGGFHLKGKLRPHIVQQVLTEIINRHETLRTVFPAVDGRPVQIVQSSAVLRLPLLDLSGLPQWERGETLQSLLEASALLPFDLANGPLFRPQLLRLTLEEHLLHISVHHIIFDGWSLGVLMREFVQLYEAFVRGEPSPLPVLPIQYADFAQEQWFQGAMLREQLAYWMQQLHDPPQHLKLPTDYPRPAIQSFAGARYVLTVPAQLSQELLALCTRQGVTLFMTLLSAFAILLGRLTGQSDLLIGAPIANRTRVELEDLIGCFINTLVLRINLAGNLRVRDLLAQVHYTAMDAYAHQDLPFEQVVEELRPIRDTSRNPLFQAMFVLQNAPLAEEKLTDLTVEILPAPAQVTPFDLSLFLWETDTGLQGFIEYATDLFQEKTIAGLAARLQVLLQAMVYELDLPIADLPLLTPLEQRRLLEKWNATQVIWPQSSCLTTLITQKAHQVPDALAVVHSDLQLSYQALDQQANHLAHHLHTLGVGPEVLVGVCMQRSPALVVTLLAILKAGGGYVPVDPSYPVERQAFILHDAGVSLLLTQHRLAGRFRDQVPHLLCLDSEDSALLYGCQEKGPDLDILPETLAYVIYTSGSTGVPKGVMISHRALYNHMLWMQAVFPLLGTDRVLQKTPFGFDASIWEFYAPLLAGASLVLASPDGHQDSAYLAETIAREQISILQVVPMMLHALLDQPIIKTCHSLRRVFCGGEELGADLQTRALATLSIQTALINLYGPTECTIDATFWICERESLRQRVPIGQPITNTQLHILDHQGAPAPVGVPGELYIGGKGVARGYQGRPELTAERFVPDPFTGEKGERLYRTGDLVRYRVDGALEYLGRIDTQVKVRGYRIELSEIEAALSQHPQVHTCAVALREDGEGDKQLIGYLVAHKDEKSNPVNDVRAYLRKRLPEYMLPGHWVVLDALPLTPNGKVDRRALLALNHGQKEETRTYTAPRTPLEAQLAHIWAEVLKVEQATIGILDNFFERGGHSLKATQVIARMKQTSGVDLQLDHLFEHPTIEEMAQCIQNIQGLRKQP